MTSTDLGHRVAVSQDYDMLQGLMPAAFGAGLFLAAVTGSTLLLYAGIAVSSLLAPWYRKRYGTLRGSYRRSLAAIAVAACAIVALVAVEPLDRSSTGPVQWTPLVMAAMMLAGFGLGLRHVGLTAWHWAVLALLAACSLLPLAGWRPTGTAVLAPVGLALVVIGLVDHRRLVQAFGRGADA